MSVPFSGNSLWTITLVLLCTLLVLGIVWELRVGLEATGPSAPSQTAVVDVPARASNRAFDALEGVKSL